MSWDERINEKANLIDIRDKRNNLI